MLVMCLCRVYMCVYVCVMYLQQLFAEAANQKQASELSVELLQTFAVTLEQLALADDKPRSASLTCVRCIAVSDVNKIIFARPRARP